MEIQKIHTGYEPNYLAFVEYLETTFGEVDPEKTTLLQFLNLFIIQIISQSVEMEDAEQPIHLSDMFITDDLQHNQSLSLLLSEARNHVSLLALAETSPEQQEAKELVPQLSMAKQQLALLFAKIC